MAANPHGAHQVGRVFTDRVTTQVVAIFAGVSKDRAARHACTRIQWQPARSFCCISVFFLTRRWNENAQANRPDCEPSMSLKNNSSRPRGDNSSGSALVTVGHWTITYIVRHSFTQKRSILRYLILGSWQSGNEQGSKHQSLGHS